MSSNGRLLWVLNIDEGKIFRRKWKFDKFEKLSKFWDSNPKKDSIPAFSLSKPLFWFFLIFYFCFTQYLMKILLSLLISPSLSLYCWIIRFLAHRLCTHRILYYHPQARNQKTLERVCECRKAGMLCVCNYAAVI